MSPPSLLPCSALATNRIFTHRFPLAFDSEDANFYRYAFNEPTNATDPSGLEEVKWTQEDLVRTFDKKVVYKEPEQKVNGAHYYSVPIKTIVNPSVIDGRILAVSGVDYYQKGPDDKELKLNDTGGIFIAYIPDKDNAKLTAAAVKWIQFVSYRIRWFYEKADMKEGSSEDYYMGVKVGSTRDSDKSRTHGTEDKPIYYVDSAARFSPVYSSLSAGSSRKDMAFIFDRPTRPTTIAKQIGQDILDNKVPKAKWERLIRAEVTFYSDSYAVVNGKAFAQVSWQTVPAIWSKEGGVTGIEEMKGQQGWPIITYAGPVKTGKADLAKQMQQQDALNNEGAEYEKLVKYAQENKLPYAKNENSQFNNIFPNSVETSETTRPSASNAAEGQGETTCLRAREGHSSLLPGLAG